MKKSLSFAWILSSIISYAQEGHVGINTDTPKATLHVESKVTSPASPQGIIPPYATSLEIDSWTGMVRGTLVYNTVTNCIEVYNGSDWISNCDGSTPPTPSPAVPSPISLPNGIKLNSSSKSIVSIFDEDYLPYTMPASAATWSSTPADGVKESVKIDIKGKIPYPNGIQVKIPVTVNVGVTIPAYEQKIYINEKYKTTDGKRQNIILSWAPQNLSTSDKYITATIKPEQFDLNIKQLDVNSGIGKDLKGLELVTFTYPQENGSTATSSFQLRVIAGIPDRYYGKKTRDYAGSWANNAEEHNFIYIPIKGADGKIWLNHNLGAEYTDANDPRGNFDPAKKPDSMDDYLAFGSFFQWQRIADGHELMSWTSQSSGTASLTTSTKASSWTNAGTNNFIASSTTDEFWVVNALATAGPHNLWQANGSNNPCPSGFHVPTKNEFQNWINRLGSPDGNGAFEDLHLTSTSFRHYMGNFGYSTRTHYSISERGATGNVSALYMRGNDQLNTSYSYGNGLGMSVRCIQD
jgi:hypothetical protein